MKAWWLGLLCPSIAIAADLGLSLPTGSEDTRDLVAGEEWEPAAGLLTDQEAGEQPDDTRELPLPTTAEMTQQDAANQIPVEFLDEYFAQRPEAFLIDPQGLLSPSESRGRLAFLSYHSADSKIDFYVYVFGPEQEIPSEVRDEEISERLFGEGKPSLALFYYLGAPDRSEILLSPSLSDAVSDAERRRILQSSVLAATERPDAISQLEAFCVQACIRIFWIEKAAGLVDVELPDSAETAEAILRPDSPSRTEVLKQMFDAFWWKWGAIVSVSCSGALISLGSWMLARRRVRYRFPEFDVASRLGGDHAAGVGAVIGFGNTTQSPSAQHSGTPDYFGGI